MYSSAVRTCRLPVFSEQTSTTQGLYATFELFDAEKVEDDDSTR